MLARAFLAESPEYLPIGYCQYKSTRVINNPLRRADGNCRKSAVVLCNMDNQADNQNFRLFICHYVASLSKEKVQSLSKIIDRVSPCGGTHARMYPR